VLGVQRTRRGLRRACRQRLQALALARERQRRASDLQRQAVQALGLAF
jgi:hypothetical protein